MKSVKIAAVIAILLMSSGGAFAQRRAATDYFLRPQAGIWFGPVTPVYTTRDDVDTNLGGGLYFRYNTPYQPLKLGFDASYQRFKSDGVNELTLWPVYGSMIYRIPIKFPLAFQVKAGAGGANVTIGPDNEQQWDPMGMVGFETSFPAGRYINIGLRIDYLFIYESYLPGATHNGHIVNTGITLYFNLGGK
jgi:hypothetical protein